MAQNSVSSPWAHPIGTSGTPVAKPGSSGICIFRPWSSQGHRTTLLALLPGIPAPFSHSHDRLHPVSEYAKAPSSPGLATVEDGVQSPREERVLIWPVSGDHHVHASTITALEWSVVTHPRAEAGSTRVHRCTHAVYRPTGSDYPLHVLLVSAGISCSECLCRGGPCTLHVHTYALIHTLTLPSAPERPPPLPRQTWLAQTLSHGSRGMQKQAGKGPRPEFQSLK